MNSRIDIDDMHLPDGWSRQVSTSMCPGRPHYFNCLTGETSWMHPYEENMVETKMRCRKRRSLSASDCMDDSICDEYKVLADRARFRRQRNQFRQTTNCHDYGERCGVCKHAAHKSDDPDENELSKWFEFPISSLPESRSICVCPLINSVYQVVMMLVKACAGDSPIHSISVESDTTSPIDSNDNFDFDWSIIAPPATESDLGAHPEWVKSFDLGPTCNASIDIREYITRLWAYGRLSDATVFNGILYLIQLVLKKRITLSPQNVYKFILSAVFVSAKFLEDSHLTNEVLASIGGVRVVEFNDLELKFLNLMHFELKIDHEAFFAATQLLSCPHYVLSILSDRHDDSSCGIEGFAEVLQL